ncbi:Hypothetical protein HDN1F_24440 [gamma proteobacterium HdN1]|nr:Hypothetical protein HDN1F_24440 [gamma proteobacterium HdN1]
MDAVQRGLQVLAKLAIQGGDGRIHYAAALLFSLLGSLLTLTQPFPISSDGGFYLSLADIYQSKGLSALFDYYDMPWYPALVGFVHRLLPLSTFYTAFLLNTLLTSAACVLFVAIVRQQSARASVAWFAVAFICLFPAVNELKGQIYREFGLWAFTLGALFCLIRYERAPRLGLLCGWFVLQLLAGFFKEEGFALLLAGLPVLLQPHTRSVRSWLYILPLVGLLGITLWFMKYLSLGHAVSAPQADYIARLSAMFVHVQQDIDHFGDAFLNRYSAKHAGVLYLCMLLILLALSIMKAMKLAVVLLGMYFWRANRSEATGSVALVSYIAFAALVLWVYLLENHFLAARYTVLLILLVMLWVIPRIAPRFEWQGRGNKVWLIAVLGLFFLDSFVSIGPSDSHLAAAKSWLAQHAGQNDKVISSHRGYSYALGRLDKPADGLHDTPDAAILQRYNYYIVLNKPKQPTLKVPDNAMEVAHFENEKHYSAVIYRLK